MLKACDLLKTFRFHLSLAPDSSCMFVRVLRPMLFPARGGRTRLKTLKAILTKLTLEIGCPSYH